MGNFKLKHVIITGAMIALCILANPGNAKAKPFKFPKMFEFARNALEIDKTFKVPTVNIVSRETITELYRLAWRAGNPGKTMPTKSWSSIKKGLLGSYHADSDIIYVLRGQEHRDESIVHEYVHWLQTHVEGKLDWQNPDAIFIHMFREMQAYQIGKRYKEVKHDFSK